MGIFLEGEDSHGDHGLGRLVEFRFKAPPGTTSSSITTHTSLGQRNCTSWASQPQKSVTLLPCPGGGTTKSTKDMWRHWGGGNPVVSTWVLNYSLCQMSGIYMGKKTKKSKCTTLNYIVTLCFTSKWNCLWNLKLILCPLTPFSWASSAICKAGTKCSIFHCVSLRIEMYEWSWGWMSWWLTADTRLLSCLRLLQFMQLHGASEKLVVFQSMCQTNHYVSFSSNVSVLSVQGCM